MARKPRLVSKQLATTLAWERGLLSYKLYPYQMVLYRLLWAAIKNPALLKFVLNCSRRWGKSTVLCLIAIEFALRSPNMQIRFAAPTAKMLNKITRPIFKKLIKDCPQHLRPVFHIKDNMWQFPNGSEIHMAGTDNQNAENLRGTASDLNLIDEAGFCDDLDYVIRDILLPQTLTTGGKTLLASTPPKTPAHDFYAIAMECEVDGNYAMFTIDDNPTIDQRTKDLYAKESGGYNSTTYKREYLCQFVVDESLALVSEWDEKRFVAEPVDTEISPYFHRYTAMDMGFRDYTAVLFGRYDFAAATLYVEAELTANGHDAPKMATDALTTAISEQEAAVFKGQKPYRRIADNNNPIMLMDMLTMHKMSFSPTDKDNLEAMLNELKMLVRAGRVRVSPKCTKLLGCLRYGVWNAKRTEFARSTTFGHFDHLAALIYLVRNIDKVTNPVPATHGTSPFTHHISSSVASNLSPTARQIAKLFNPRSSRE